MSKPRCYLAGPINGLSYTEATDWRGQAAAALAAAGIDAFSPMRTKEFLADKADLTWSASLSTDPMATSKGIQCRDFTDCTRADALLVNFTGATKASIGSCFELAWGYYLRIPMVVVAEHNNIHVVHPMALEMLDFRVDTLAEGIRIVKHILLSEGS